MDIEEDKEYENFKNRLLQRPITFLTEENLDKLEEHCRKAIRYERGIEHKVVLELLERYKEFLAEREEDKKKIAELEAKLEFYQWGDLDNLKFEEYMKEFIPKQKVKDLKESIVLEPTIVGGRRNAKTLEYGIKLGKIKACEELLEDK